MKIIKGLPIFSILVVLFGSCFNPPELSSVPQLDAIGLEDLAFIVTPDLAQQDTLAITVNFKDGDGDLGLDPLDPVYNSAPYNELNYFLENNGSLIAVPTKTVYSNLPPFISLPPNTSGKLVTVRTRKEPGYEQLPAYAFPASCLNYIYGKVYVDGTNNYIFDKTYNVDTILRSGNTTITVLLDTFNYQTNPNHYNFDVDFLIKNPQYKPNSDVPAEKDEYIIYDWKLQQNCSSNFYGRFPVLSEKTPRPLEGSLRYTMKSSGFLPIFGTRPLKLQVRIRDRALHVSNTVTTKEFTLTQIRK